MQMFHTKGSEVSIDINTVSETYGNNKQNDQIIKLHTKYRIYCTFLEKMQIPASKMNTVFVSGDKYVA